MYAIRSYYDVKDVCLEVYGKTIHPNVEIADCQGADSTDPAVLEKIFSYLEAANRITSYNVCYTKLLRPSAFNNRPPAAPASGFASIN